MARIEIAKKTDLQGKANVDHNHDGTYQPAGNYADATHTHSYDEITGKPTIPTKTSDITNDSGFITSSDVPSVPTNNNQLTNGAGYINGSYDNTSSGLTATEIQAAIDELKALIDSLGGA